MKEQLNPRNVSRNIFSSSGFSLIELLIVVCVIMIIAAIAIPNFIRSKEAANESSAASNMRNISTAEFLYSSTYGAGYSPNLPSLSGNTGTPAPTHAELIDQVLASGTKSGYVISYTPGTPDAQGRIISYAINANPLVPGSTGQRFFYSDQTCVIRWNNTAPAGPTDIPIQ